MTQPSPGPLMSFLTSPSQREPALSVDWLDEIRIPDFEMTFVGPISHPSRTDLYNPSSFWLGSESGEVALFEQSHGVVARHPEATESRSTVNGVAYSRGILAVSTPEEVSILHYHPAGANSPDIIFPVGAHGVAVAPSSGHFIIPAGRSGLLLISPDTDTILTAPYLQPCDPIRVFYKVIALPSPLPYPKTNQESDFLVCACRTGGLGIMEYSYGQEGKQTYQIQVSSLMTEKEDASKVDVVDVCRVGEGASRSCAIAALGSDGSLYLIPDLTRIAKSSLLKMNFQTIQGTAYSVRSVGDHLFVLTSKGLYGLMNLGRRILETAKSGDHHENEAGFFESVETPIVVMESAEMVDAEILNNRWLMVILLDRLLQIDVTKLAGNIPEQFRAAPEKGRIFPLLRGFNTLALPSGAVA